MTLTIFPGILPSLSLAYIKKDGDHITAVKLKILAAGIRGILKLGASMISI